MNKKRNLTRSVPIRLDPATLANIQTIIASGLAADRSAALRAGAAALAHTLTDDPRVWIVHINGHEQQIYSTQPAAIAWLQGQGAQHDERTNQWYTSDDDGNPETWYTLQAVIPR